MTRLRTVVLLVIVAAVAVFATLWFRHSHATPVNVLLITLDTTRADRLGCYGHASARTPALDGIADKGVLFEDARSPVPSTLPSHATIMTGLYPPEHGLRLNAEGSLPEDVETLAEILKSNGYITGAFIAATVLDSNYGLDAGFDTYDDEISEASRLGTEDHPYRPASEINAAVLPWLKENGDKSFFCWVHYFDPHWPYYAHRDEFGTEFDRREYDGEIAYSDLHVAELLELLEEMGVDDRTLVVVAGDHGESLDGEHNEPRPYHGYMVYDSTLHVPFLFKLPGRVPAGRRVSTPVSLIDLFPTLLDLLGLPDESGGGAHGISLVSALEGREPVERSLYAETFYPSIYFCRPQQAIVAEGRKYIRSPIPELYDLAVDPAELTNQAPARPEIVDDLDAQLAELEGDMEQRTAVSVTLSDAERRRLESLGYIGGGGGSPDVAMSLTRDIKDMAPVIKKGIRADDAARNGYRQMAIGLLTEVSRECPECTSYSSQLATMFLAEKDYDKAVVVFRNLVNRLRRRASGEGLPLLSREENTYSIASFNLGLSLGQLRRFEEAIPYVEEAVERKPGLSYMKFTLGELYDKVGQSRKALEICESADMERPPPECVLLLAELHNKVGSQSRAKRLALAVLQTKNIKPHQREQASAILGLDDVAP